MNYVVNTRELKKGRRSFSFKQDRQYGKVRNVQLINQSDQDMTVMDGIKLPRDGGREQLSTDFTGHGHDNTQYYFTFDVEPTYERVFIKYQQDQEEL